MKKNHIFWNPDHELVGTADPDYMCEIEFADTLGIDLFGAEETFTFAGPASVVAQDPRKKVVLKHWRNWEGISVPKEDLSWADLLVLYTNDVITGPWESYCAAAMEQFNCKNFICITEGRHMMDDHDQDRVYEDHEHHSNRIVNFCHYDLWNLSLDKPKVFDALIGSVDNGYIKAHRQFLFSQLLENRLLGKSFVNAWGSVNFRSPELAHLDDPAIVHLRNSTIYGNNFKNGRSMSYSIPTEVYKRSWYSLVAETMAEKSNYITEKTSKPLFERRIFVVFGAQGLLSRLHDLGYQTFGSHIDESYDNEPNNEKRWAMAFDEVMKLSKLTSDRHQKNYQELYPVLEHNHQTIVNNQRNRLQGLKDFLDRHISKL